VQIGQLPFGLVDMGKVLEVLDDLLDAFDALAGFLEQGLDVLLEEIQFQLLPSVPWRARGLGVATASASFVGSQHAQYLLDISSQCSSWN